MLYTGVIVIYYFFQKMWDTVLPPAETKLNIMKDLENLSKLAWFYAKESMRMTFYDRAFKEKLIMIVLNMHYSGTNIFFYTCTRGCKCQSQPNRTLFQEPRQVL